MGNIFNLGYALLVIALIQSPAAGQIQITLFGEDQNQDGQVLLQLGETDPTNPQSFPLNEQDTDRDGLSDAFEINFEKVVNDRLIKLDFLDQDSDDDGLSDGDEYNGKGLCRAGAEYWQSPLAVQPWLPDSDFDGIPDGTELGVRVPIPEFSTIYNGQQVTIKGTDIEAKFDFRVWLTMLPLHYNGGEEVSPLDDVEYIQYRYCFRVDDDPGYEGHYFTHPVNSDTNNDGVVDGLQDFNQQIVLEEMDDPSKYNAPGNYNGKYKDTEFDALTGLYEVPSDWETHVGQYMGGGFAFIGGQAQDIGGRSLRQIYLIAGPSVDGMCMRFASSARDVQITPTTINILKTGEKYLVDFVGNFNQLGRFSVRRDFYECSVTAKKVHSNHLLVWLGHKYAWPC
ncbi:MAG: hypothetical protein RLY93_00430 [Sumerlaeia bacterium]